jgi:hypothetical protein
MITPILYPFKLKSIPPLDAMVFCTYELDLFLRNLKSKNLTMDERFLESISSFKMVSKYVTDIL